ncbi:hypothetical protein EJB05_39987, partial [Eragrostis curvula]
MDQIRVVNVGYEPCSEDKASDRHDGSTHNISMRKPCDMVRSGEATPMSSGRRERDTKGACNNSFFCVTNDHRHHWQYSTMKKLLCVVLVASLLLDTLAGASSSPPLASSLSRQQAQVLGRKGRELGQLAYQHEQNSENSEISSYVRPQELVDFPFHYLRKERSKCTGRYLDGSSFVAVQEVVMEVKKPAEKKAAWTDHGDDGKEKGLIYNADYEGVAMHAGPPPKHKHPKP